MLAEGHLFNPVQSGALEDNFKALCGDQIKASSAIRTFQPMTREMCILARKKTPVRNAQLCEYCANEMKLLVISFPTSLFD